MKAKNPQVLTGPEPSQRTLSSQESEGQDEHGKASYDFHHFPPFGVWVSLTGLTHHKDRMYTFNTLVVFIRSQRGGNSRPPPVPTPRPRNLSRPWRTKVSLKPWLRNQAGPRPPSALVQRGWEGVEDQRAEEEMGGTGQSSAGPAVTLTSQLQMTAALCLTLTCGVPSQPASPCRSPRGG